MACVDEDRRIEDEFDCKELAVNKKHLSGVTLGLMVAGASPLAYGQMSGVPMPRTPLYQGTSMGAASAYPSYSVPTGNVPQYFQNTQPSWNMGPSSPFQLVSQQDALIPQQIAPAAPHEHVPIQNSPVLSAPSGHPQPTYAPYSDPMIQSGAPVASYGTAAPGCSSCGTPAMDNTAWVQSGNVGYGAPAGSCGCGSNGYGSQLIGDNCGGAGVVGQGVLGHGGIGRGLFGHHALAQGSCGAGGCGSGLVGSGYYGQGACGPAVGGFGGHLGHGHLGQGHLGMGLNSRLAYGGGPSTIFAGGGALFYSRQDDRYVRLTNDSAMPTDAVLSTRSARIGTAPGVQAFVGKYINCGRNAIIGSYWGLFPDSESASVMPGAGGNLRTTLPFTTLGPGGDPATLAGLEMPAQNVYDWYDGAAAHRIVRENEIHNIELSLLGFGIGGASVSPAGSCCDPCPTCMGGWNSNLAPACASRLRLGWLAGVRWMRFNDYMEYATSETDTLYNYGADDFFYRNRVVNDLVGFQLGGYGSYCIGKRANLYAGSKFGVYGNHMQFDTYAGTATQAATVVSANAYNGQAYNLMASRTDIAFLGEGDVGMSFRLGRCWSANVGYRAVAVSGLATAVGQIPYRFEDLMDVQRINNSSSLLLHGIYFGGSYNF